MLIRNDCANLKSREKQENEHVELRGVAAENFGGGQIRPKIAVFTENV